jgi:microcystin-dependent protein
MSDPFIGEIRIWANTFPPRNWAYCDGSLLDIAQYTALYSILGTSYGGNGRTTVGLPNLTGRAPMGMGLGPGLSSRYPGQIVGSQGVMLTPDQIAAHTHQVDANDTLGATDAPDGNYLAQGSKSAGPVPLRKQPIYNTTANTSMAVEAASATGGNQPHYNMQPYLNLSFCIALDGLYPSRN